MVVLKVYDFTGNGETMPITLEDNRCYCTHNSNGEDQLTFELQRKSDDYVYITEEALIEGFGNRFAVKKIEEQSDFVVVTCNLDFSDWLDTIYVNFRKTNVTLPQAIQFILPSGWIVLYGEGVDITKHTTVEYQEGQAFRATNAKTILSAIAEAFGVVFNYDMLKNELKVININSYLPSGDYFIEDLNMSNLKFTGNSSNLVTRLYVYGKKDEQTGEYVTIASVNDGKEYLEDFTYTDKIVVDSVVDERYTIPQELKEYGQSILAEKCIPSRSYSFDVSNVDGTIYLYKVVTIVDSRRKLKINHQCIKYIEYKNHLLDKITLSSVTPSIGGILNNVSSGYASASNQVQAMNNTIQTMESLIIGTDGNFKWILNSSGEKEEFLILVDSDSIGTATKLFKLDNTGLYYSSTGYNGEYDTLINQDGLVVSGIPDGGVSTAKIADEAVTSAKLDSGAVLEAKLADAVKNKLNPIVFESSADFESKIYGGSDAIMESFEPHLFVGMDSWSQTFIGSSFEGKSWGICFCYSEQLVHCLYMYNGDLYKSVWNKINNTTSITTQKIPSTTWT